MMRDYSFNKLVKDFIQAGVDAGELPLMPEGMKLVTESDTEERVRPCLVIGSEESEQVHPRMMVRNLDLQFLIQRNDTEQSELESWVTELKEWMEASVKDLAEELLESSYLLRHWVYDGEISDEDEKRAWRSGMSYRVTVIQLV